MAVWSEIVIDGSLFWWVLVGNVTRLAFLCFDSCLNNRLLEGFQLELSKSFMLIIYCFIVVINHFYLIHF